MQKSYIDKVKKTYLTKKRIDYVEKTYDEKWKIVEKKDRVSYIDYNNNFTKFFHFDFKKYKLSKSWNELLLIIISTLWYWNEIFLTDLKRNWAKSYVSLKKALGELKKYKIIFPTAIRGFYILNPHIAYRWNTETYKKLIWFI